MAGIGNTLRSARIQRGLTIEQAAQDTRISPRFLEALEAEQFDSLPAQVYVRGFLRSYANYLRLDAAPLLAALEASGPPAADPGSIVGGPPPLRPQAGPARPDPFRAPQRQAPPPLPVPPPPSFFDEPIAESWAPEETGDEPVVPAGAYAPEAFSEEPGLPPEEPVFRPRRVAGVLVEREPVERDSGRTARLLALAGGAAIVVLVAVIAALALTGGDGDDPNPAGAATETPTRPAGTIIAVVSPTATPSASPSPGASASPSPSASASPSPSGTPSTPTPTATNRPNPPAATATPTETPTPTATAVLPTLFPPTPFPTTLAHPLYYSLCVNNSCGDPPYRVVCVPDGTWFVDVPRTFPVPSAWRIVNVQKQSQIGAACN